MKLKSGGAAFVTGGASGIGLGIARALAAAGQKLILADIDESALRATSAALTEQGSAVLPITLDVRNPEQWATAAEKAWTWAGGVQILCNSAGVVFHGAFTEQPIELWKMVQDINVFGSYLGARTFLPRMLPSGAPGHIVNIASIAGLWGGAKLAAYTASKFAVLGMSEALQLELARTQIGLSVVFPGATRTNLSKSAPQIAERERISAVGWPDTAVERNRMDPDAIGRRVVEAIGKEEFYVITHPDWLPLVETRYQIMRAAFGAPAQAGYSDDAEAVQKLAARFRESLSAKSSASS